MSRRSGAGPQADPAGRAVGEGSKRSRAAAPGRPASIGLALVALGWVVLLAGTCMPDAIASALAMMAAALGRPMPTGPKVDLTGIAQCMILSGFGFAILATLHNGFGALNRFFEAVLQRSVAAKAQASPSVTMPERSQRPQVAERGRIKGRSYVLFADGSVEVETLLGPRHFTSFQEAQEFVGF